MKEIDIKICLKKIKKTKKILQKLPWCKKKKKKIKEEVLVLVY